MWDFKTSIVNVDVNSAVVLFQAIESVSKKTIDFKDVITLSSSKDVDMAIYNHCKAVVDKLNEDDARTQVKAMDTGYLIGDSATIKANIDAKNAKTPVNKTPEQIAQEDFLKLIIADREALILESYGLPTISSADTLKAIGQAFIPEYAALLPFKRI